MFKTHRQWTSAVLILSLAIPATVYGQANYQWPAPYQPSAQTPYPPTPPATYPSPVAQVPAYPASASIPRATRSTPSYPAAIPATTQATYKTAGYTVPGQVGSTYPAPYQQVAHTVAVRADGKVEELEEPAVRAPIRPVSQPVRVAQANPAPPAQPVISIAPAGPTTTSAPVGPAVPSAPAGTVIVPQAPTYVGQAPVMSSQLPLAEYVPGPEMHAGSVDYARVPAGPEPGVSFTMPFRSDRPKYTQTVETVGDGNWQVSGGYTYSRNERPSAGDPVRFRHQAGEFLARYGVSDHLELRFAFDGYMHEQYIVGDNGGLSRASVGFKTIFCEQDVWRPAMGLVGDLGFPVGDDDFDGGGVVGGLAFNYRWNISVSTEVGGSIGARHNQEYSDQFREFDFSLYTQSRLWNELYGFAEYVGRGYDDKANSFPDHMVQSGLIYFICPNVQLDARIGCGMDRGDDFFIGVGATILK